MPYSSQGRIPDGCPWGIVSNSCLLISPALDQGDYQNVAKVPSRLPKLRPTSAERVPRLTQPTLSAASPPTPLASQNAQRATLPTRGRVRRHSSFNPYASSFPVAP